MSFVYALMVAGALVSDRDLIAIILNSLSSDYESFIDSIMLRISSTSLDELLGLMFNKKMFMSCKKKTIVSFEPFQAFDVQYQNSSPSLLPMPQKQSFPQAFVAQSTNNYPSNNN